MQAGTPVLRVTARLQVVAGAGRQATRRAGKLHRCGSPTPATRFAPAQVEKYRPTRIKDIVGNVEAVSRLQIIAEEGNMPNVILSVGRQRARYRAAPLWCSEGRRAGKLQQTFRDGLHTATGRLRSRPAAAHRAPPAPARPPASCAWRTSCWAQTSGRRCWS